MPHASGAITGCRRLVTRPAGRRTDGPAGDRLRARERQMGDTDDFSAMDDPEFLAERRRVRELIEALRDRYEALTREFDRRAAAKWASGDAA